MDCFEPNAAVQTWRHKSSDGKATNKIRHKIRSRSTRTEMSAGRVVYCPLVSHVEHAPRALLMLEKRWDSRTDRRTDGRTPDRYITLTARLVQRINSNAQISVESAVNTSRSSYRYFSKIDPRDFAVFYIIIICVMCIRKYECMHCIILYFVATCKRPFVAE